MDVIYTDPAWRDISIISDGAIDCAYGSGENDFELTLDEHSEHQPREGALVYIEGTEYGGIIDEIERDSKDQTMTYKGRSIHGMLAAKVFEPDRGQDFLIVSGEANQVLRQLIERIGLSSVIEVAANSSGVYINRFQFVRYTDAWTGILRMLSSSGLRPHFSWERGRAHMEAVAVASYSAEDSDLLTFSAAHAFRPVNHLICLGQGDLKDRVVLHFFADEKGRISTNQTFFGKDEVSAVYDYSSAEYDELEKKGKEKLEGLQDASSIKFNLASDKDYALGDIISSVDPETGLEITAQIAKKIVKVQGDRVRVEYTVGGEAKGVSLSSGGGSSSSGGISYTAGKGIKIQAGVISAEVEAKDLASIRATAETAKSQASTAEATANAAITEVLATGNISATRQDKAVTIAHRASGVVAGNYGAETNSTPAFGESVNIIGQSVDTSGHISACATYKLTIPKTEASTTASGLMSAKDKQKLDAIEARANAFTLTPATNAKLGGVKPDGKTITIASDGTITAQSATSSSSFLSSWPVGSIYSTSSPVSPQAKYGGTWRELPTMNGFKFERIS